MDCINLVHFSAFRTARITRKDRSATTDGSAY